MRLQQYIIESEDKEIKQRWDQYVKSDPMIKNAVSILEKIEKHGKKAWIAGGAVRDLILGEKPHDIDIVTDMEISELAKIFKVYDIGRSKEFGIVAVTQGGYQYEIAMLRGESYMKPKTVRKILK